MDQQISLNSNIKPVRSRFVNLKVHSIYSVLQSTLSIKSIAHRAAELGHAAVCLTDHNLYGALEFSIRCLAINVKPIIGCKIRIAFDKQVCDILITLVVMTPKGYDNLLILINESEVIDNTYVVN